MFCGESFDLEGKEIQDISESTLNGIKADYQTALMNISYLVDNIQQQLPKFTKAHYTTSFEEYVQNGASILIPTERYAALSDDNVSIVVEETAKALIEAIEKDISNSKGEGITSSKKRLLDQYRFFLAVYTIPMIRFLKYEISEPLAESIIDKWRNRYPQYAFNKGDYSELKSGFERKGLCFITTAVCERMDKPDDCYELKTFRKFRDTYMQQTKERQELVEEYYRIAPVIVASIDLQPNRIGKYNDIWQEYLQPCLKDMEDNYLDKCEERYAKMVQNLRAEYMI
jgi:hypothetical protein